MVSKAVGALVRNRRFRVTALLLLAPLVLGAAESGEGISAAHFFLVFAAILLACCAVLIRAAWDGETAL